ncbi:uncharacterized protein DS421_20g704990 [Arachis hypogaea]|nr:uncharacterized protein DS421_20g704990 [Arachis hypogaea]
MKILYYTLLFPPFFATFLFMFCSLYVVGKAICQCIHMRKMTNDNTPGSVHKKGKMLDWRKTNQRIRL